MRASSCMALALALLAAVSSARAASIVETAQATPDLSILVEAVIAANLVEAVTPALGEPITVLAPTNKAFAALLAALGVTKEELLANKAVLQAILPLHVIPSAVLSSDLIDGMVVETLGGPLTVSVSNEGVFFTSEAGVKAKVVTADVLADGSVVHVIDSVLLPNLELLALAEAPAAEAEAPATE